MQRSHIHASLVAAAFVFAGCSGPGAGLAPAPADISGATSAAMPPSGTNATLDTARSGGATNAAAINGLNSIGAAVMALADESSGEGPKKQPSGTGVCHKGQEFYAPDKAGDPSSTEREYFFDAGCTKLARDFVRIYASTGSNSETVNTTAKNYAYDTGALLSTRTAAVQYSNATFSFYGWTIEADGFDRNAQGTTVTGTRTVDSDNEFIISPASNGIQAYCTNWAGFSATGIAKLNEAFGWAGGMLDGGTRTLNANGSITWSGSRNATSYEGPIGSLSITQGTANTSCPISTPNYGIAGGTVKGTSIGTITATLDEGTLESLQISRQSQSGGYSLTAASNSSVSPNSPNFITGTIERGSTQVATFSVNAVGDGTLNVTATGQRYYVAGWVVVR